MMVDTSAVLAILLGEDDQDALTDLVAAAERPFVTPIVEIEAATVLATRRGCTVIEALTDVRELLRRLRVETRPLVPDAARWAAEAYQRFGKGRHPARLNLGDCLSYGAACAAGVGLIYKGNDFAQTDLAISMVSGRPS